MSPLCQKMRYYSISLVLTCFVSIQINAFVPNQPKNLKTNSVYESYQTNHAVRAHSLLEKNCGKNCKMTNRFRNNANSVLKMGMLDNLNLDDLIYNAESTAGSLADYSISGAADTGTLSVLSLTVLFFAGLLTSFSPCSLSLLPLTVSYISTAAGEREDKAAFFPTLAFVSGLSFVFSGLGLSVSLLGGVFGQSMSLSDNFMATLSLVILSSGVSIAMGLQLLELINIPLPSLDVELPFLKSPEDLKSSENMDTSEIIFDDDGMIVQKPPSLSLQTESPNPKNSLALVRVFLLGGSCALLESPCATPVLTSILAFVGVSRNPILGATLLLTYTIGYSTPLLIVGATGGEALAKLRASSMDDDVNNVGWITKIGQYVSPATGAVLIWYGTNSFLTGIFGDASLTGLSPIL